MRRTIEDALVAGVALALEVTPEGRIAAYTESNSGHTLAATALSALIGEAVSTEALSAKDGPTALERLEADLAAALEIVRRVRGS